MGDTLAGAALRGVADYLGSEHAPTADPDCAFCDYVARAAAAG